MKPELQIEDEEDLDLTESMLLLHKIEKKKSHHKHKKGSQSQTKSLVQASAETGIDAKSTLLVEQLGQLSKSIECA